MMFRPAEKALLALTARHCLKDRLQDTGGVFAVTADLENAPR